MLNRFIPAALLALALSGATTLTAQTATTTAASAEKSLPADSATANIPPLTLEQCVAMALDKNFDLKIQRIDTAASANSLEIAKATYDPTLSAGITHSYSRTDPTSAGGINSGQNTNLSADIVQSIITGATLQVGYSANRANPRSSSDYYGSGLNLTVRQPLLKNFGTTVNRSAMDKARLGIDRANYNLKGTVLSTVRAVESAYFNLAFVRARLEVRKVSLENAQTLLNENRTRKEVGTATPLDVLQAEVGVATAQRDILVAQQAVKNAEDTLLALINPFQFEAAIGPLAISETAAPKVNFAQSYKLARENSPDLASARIAVKQSEIDLAVAKQNRLPQLDIVGSAGYDATRNAFGDAFTHTLDQHNHDWSIGAQVTYPWGQRRDKANLANAKANLDALNIGYEQLDQSVLVQVRTAIRGVETSDEGVRITALATKLSEQQYELEKARYDQGLSTFRRVQEAKEDLDTARIAELDARVSLRNALADLARLEGSSLGRYNIQLAAQ